MKSILFSGLLWLALASTSIAQTSTPFVVDVRKSSLKWTGKKVTGSHWGYVKFSNGTAYADGGQITGGNFVVNMDSLSVQDLKPETGGKKLLGHLRSNDFFAVDNHKTAELKLKSVTQNGEIFDCVADLTIKGITNEIKFIAQMNIVDYELTATATLHIDRTKWDIKYGSGTFFSDLGDKTINDEFVLEINLVANAEKPKKTEKKKPTSTTRKKPK